METIISASLEVKLIAITIEELNNFKTRLKDNALDFETIFQSIDGDKKITIFLNISCDSSTIKENADSIFHIRQLRNLINKVLANSSRDHHP